MEYEDRNLKEHDEIVYGLNKLKNVQQLRPTSSDKKGEASRAVSYPPKCCPTRYLYVRVKRTGYCLHGLLDLCVFGAGSKRRGCGRGCRCDVTCVCVCRSVCVSTKKLSRPLHWCGQKEGWGGY